MMKMVTGNDDWEEESKGEVDGDKCENYIKLSTVLEKVVIPLF